MQIKLVEGTIQTQIEAWNLRQDPETSTVNFE